MANFGLLDEAYRADRLIKARHS